MEEFISKVWKLIDLQFPLIVADMETYLLREGNISQEDYNKIKSIIKSVKNAYYSSDFNKLKIYLKDGLEQLKSIQPKKPFPPEMKARFDEVIKTMTELISQSATT
ncbi:hypothetical protein [Metallosphaera hakonensis]|uniref:Uncharacterized protein n=1 Tax=Metallosphaera hakonensis JCM 8857 = DSM 7519 TaxID=1293036 RepID=A0A2U9ITE6_9CREN|nr:hypothetical protein [Metallosphaera hakonensis]AWR99255.1 hypothetical protein DFR87_05555 [Metallosphaera hakonensis JCM 8857 = DSM 7519]